MNLNLYVAVIEIRIWCKQSPLSEVSKLRTTMFVFPDYTKNLKTFQKKAPQFLERRKKSSVATFRMSTFYRRFEVNGWFKEKY
jgi:hypothetical protein